MSGYPGHHVWCNFFMEGPVEDCDMCKGLREDYPDKGKTEEELQKEHFPNVTRISPEKPT